MADDDTKTSTTPATPTAAPDDSRASGNGRAHSKGPKKTHDHHDHHHHVPARTRVGQVSRFMDERFGLARIGRGALQKIFPNHWSFLLGEVALYSFVVLVGTGIYLTLFFNANQDLTTYDGSYVPLQGAKVSNAYNSALDITFEVKGGLLVRQIHHWAALIFIGAIVVHLARVFFTGAFRRPRELNWIIGCSLFLLSLMNGFAGYSLLDDQLSGTGLRIGYSVLLSVPFVGPWLCSLIFGGEFPGTDIIPRLYVVHILIVPLILLVLITLHLTILVKHKHAHFPGAGAKDDNVVGERLWPTYAFKAAGLFFLVFAVIALFGAIAQINPVWLYGPYSTQNVSSASQPDWYMGWLEGALRLMPSWETRIGWFTIPNPFYSGVLPAGVLFGAMYTWPWIERRFTKDHREHHVLDRPRDVPFRTALGVAVITLCTILGFAGSDDVLAVAFDMSVNALVWALRVLLVVAPPIAFLVTYRVCKELQKRDGPFVDPVLEAEQDAGDDGGGDDDSGGDPDRVPPSPEPAEPIPAKP